MKVAELVKISSWAMEVMSKHDIKLSDWRHLKMYEEYCVLRESREKFRYIITMLAEKYAMSESTVKRVVKRLAGEVIL